MYRNRRKPSNRQQPELFQDGDIFTLECGTGGTMHELSVTEGLIQIVTDEVKKKASPR